MTGQGLQLVLLSIAWVGYFAAHSLLASQMCKRWVGQRWPALIPAYRLLYNGLAILLLIPPLGLLLAAQGPPLWQWQGMAAWIANGMAALALLGFLLSTRSYDSLDFVGLRQWRQRKGPPGEAEPFTLSHWHRYVRHPWYSFALVVLWTRDMDAALLVTALWISAYFVVGSRWEERKLVAIYGARYARYRERVPALIPLPWRHLSVDEARRLMQGESDADREASDGAP